MQDKLSDMPAQTFVQARTEVRRGPGFLGFRILGFRIYGFRVEGFRVLESSGFGSS